MREILIIRISALGDVVHVLPSLRALRKRFPQARISWLVDRAGAALLEADADVDEIILFDRKVLRPRSLLSPRNWPRATHKFLQLVRRLRRPYFDVVIDFQCNLRSGLQSLLSGGKQRLSFHPIECREFGGWLFANHRARPSDLLQPKVLKNLHLVRELGWDGDCPPSDLAIPEDDRRWARAMLQELGEDGPAVVVHPCVSSFGRIKEWPAPHYRRLVWRLERELRARVLVTWGPGELEQAEAVGAGTVAPPTPRLLRLVALLAECDLVVASDTACLHIAAALGTPLVGLYGPKHPEFYGPWTDRGEVVRSDIPCSPCRLRRCEHALCMSELDPNAVFEAVRRQLAVSPRGSTCDR